MNHYIQFKYILESCDWKKVLETPDRCVFQKSQETAITDPEIHLLKFSMRDGHVRYYTLYPIALRIKSPDAFYNLLLQRYIAQDFNADGEMPTRSVLQMMRIHHQNRLMFELFDDTLKAYANANPVVF